MCIRDSLYTTPEMYVDDITLVPSIDGADGIVEYDISVKGRAGEQKAVLSEMTAIETVSYTHLDVYKRQQQYHLPWQLLWVWQFS